MPLALSCPSLLALADARDQGGEKEPPCTGNQWLPGTHGPCGPRRPPILGELAEPGSWASPLLRPGVLPTFPAHPRPQSPACWPLPSLPRGVPGVQCWHLAKHLSLRQPTFSRGSPVCWSLDKCRGDMGWPFRSSGLETTSWWKWGDHVLGAPRWVSAEDPRTPVVARRRCPSPAFVGHCLSRGSVAWALQFA